MSGLSLTKRLWGGRVSDPPVKARKWGPRMGAEPAGREPCLPAVALKGSDLHRHINYAMASCEKSAKNLSQSIK